MQGLYPCPILSDNLAMILVIYGSRLILVFVIFFSFSFLLPVKLSIDTLHKLPVVNSLSNAKAM